MYLVKREIIQIRDYTSITTSFARIIERRRGWVIISNFAYRLGTDLHKFGVKEKVRRIGKTNQYRHHQQIWEEIDEALLPADVLLLAEEDRMEEENEEGD